MSYDNNNRGALWKNDRRESDKHPHLTGSATIEGREYWVSAWTSKEGGKKPVVSFTVKPKDGERAPNPQSQDFDDDLPFNGEAA